MKSFDSWFDYIKLINIKRIAIEHKCMCIEIFIEKEKKIKKIK